MYTYLRAQCRWDPALGVHEGGLTEEMVRRSMISNSNQSIQWTCWMCVSLQMHCTHFILTKFFFPLFQFLLQVETSLYYVALLRQAYCAYLAPWKELDNSKTTPFASWMGLSCIPHDLSLVAGRRISWPAPSTLAWRKSHLPEIGKWRGLFDKMACFLTWAATFR